MTAYRSLASWRGEGPFGAWLMRIGVRIALRKAGKRRTVTWRNPLAPGRVGGPTIDPITQATDQAAMASAPLTDPADPVDARRARHRGPHRGHRAARAVSRGRRPALLRRGVARGDRAADRPTARHGQDPPAPRPGPPASRMERRAMSDLGRRFDPAELANDDPARTVTPKRPSCWPSPATSRPSHERDVACPPPTSRIGSWRPSRTSHRPGRSRCAAAWPACVTLVRDAWRMTWSGGRPLAVRAQAFALVLVAALAVGSVGSLGVVGVARLLTPATPPPTVAPAPVDRPSSLDAPIPSPSVTPSPSATPTRRRPSPRHRTANPLKPPSRPRPATTAIGPRPEGADVQRTHFARSGLGFRR